jgi:hypothetical protein
LPRQAKLAGVPVAGLPYGGINRKRIAKAAAGASVLLDDASAGICALQPSAIAVDLVGVTEKLFWPTAHWITSFESRTGSRLKDSPLKRKVKEGIISVDKNATLG